MMAIPYSEKTENLFRLIDILLDVFGMVSIKEVISAWHNIYGTELSPGSVESAMNLCSDDYPLYYKGQFEHKKNFSVCSRMIVHPQISGQTEMYRVYQAIRDDVDTAPLQVGEWIFHYENYFQFLLRETAELQLCVHLLRKQFGLSLNTARILMKSWIETMRVGYEDPVSVIGNFLLTNNLIPENEAQARELLKAMLFAYRSIPLWTCKGYTLSPGSLDVDHLQALPGIRKDIEDRLMEWNEAFYTSLHGHFESLPQKQWKHWMDTFTAKAMLQELQLRNALCDLEKTTEPPQRKQEMEAKLLELYQSQIQSIQKEFMEIVPGA